MGFGMGFCVDFSVRLGFNRWILHGSRQTDNGWMAWWTNIGCMNAAQVWVIRSSIRCTRVTLTPDRQLYKRTEVYLLQLLEPSQGQTGWSCFAHNFQTTSTKSSGFSFCISMMQTAVVPFFAFMQNHSPIQSTELNMSKSSFADWERLSSCCSSANFSDCIFWTGGELQISLEINHWESPSLHTFKLWHASWRLLGPLASRRMSHSSTYKQHYHAITRVSH